MKLSIITINYNNRAGLQKTIDSVVNQTWHDFEWIVIDGGSNDGSKELIEQYQEHFAYWCSEPDKGVYNAMNKGIAKSHGDYLSFMNSGDCFSDKNILHNVFCEDYNTEILYGDCEQIYSNYSRIVTFPQKLSLYDLYRCNICQQSMFVKKKLLLQEGFDESYHLLADWKRWIVAAIQGATFTHLNHVICKYDMNGMSSTNAELSTLDHQRILKDYPEMIMNTLKKTDSYEKDVIIQLAKALEDKGRLSKTLLKYVLKLLHIFFFRKRNPKSKYVRWVEHE